MLRKIEHKLDAIQAGVDRAAAELALPRLERELKQVELDRHARLEAAEKNPANQRAGAAFFAFVFLCVAGWVWWKASFGWAIIPFSLFLLASSAVSTPRLSNATKQINDECDQKASRLRGQLRSFRKVLDS